MNKIICYFMGKERHVIKVIGAMGTEDAHHAATKFCKQHHSNTTFSLSKGVFVDCEVQPFGWKDFYKFNVIK